MNITSFKVTDDKTAITLNIEDAATATKLYIWNKETYKVEGLQVDLSDRLNGQFSQFIVITPEDLNITYFDGVYFLEVTDGTDTAGAITSELTRYKECILEEVLAIKDCQSCLDLSNPSILNKQTLLYTLELALAENMIQETLHLVFALDKLCGSGCKGCGKTK